MEYNWFDIKIPFMPSEAYPEDDVPATSTWTVAVMPDYENNSYDRLVRYTTKRELVPFSADDEDAVEQPP